METKNINKKFDEFFFTIIGISLFICGLIIAFTINEGKIATTLLICGTFLCIFDIKKEKEKTN